MVPKRSGWFGQEGRGMTAADSGRGGRAPAKGWKLAAVERGGSVLLSLLGKTLRYQVDGEEALEAFRREGQPVILAFWHSRILPLAYFHRNQGIVVLVSEHRDGEYIARVIARKGFGLARGSSTRGGVRGLRELIRAGRSGRELALTPDGPKGPPRRVKLGALVAAQVTGLPIVPLTAGGEGVWRVSSWDRFVVPRPFSRIQVRYGPPIHVPRRAGPEELQALAEKLDGELNRITDQVDGENRDPVRPDRSYREWVGEVGALDGEQDG
ncbi:MAG: DUF374 domain-containing protein [Gemmatimonadales bacterium]|nr:MAG: DUF374 domain-containing protein [Gemmatimonadales bacterium]